MKKSRQKSPKLQLERETLTLLQENSLQDVAGGNRFTDLAPVTTCFSAG